MASPWSGIVHHLSGPAIYARTQSHVPISTGRSGGCCRFFSELRRNHHRRHQIQEKPLGFYMRQKQCLLSPRVPFFSPPLGRKPPAVREKVVLEPKNRSHSARLLTCIHRRLLDPCCKTGGEWPSFAKHWAILSQGIPSRVHSFFPFALAPKQKETLTRKQEFFCSGLRLPDRKLVPKHRRVSKVPCNCALHREKKFLSFPTVSQCSQKRLHLVKRPRSVLFIFAQIKHLPRFRSVWILLKLSTVQHDSSATKLIKWMDRLIVNHCTGLIKVAWLYSNCRSQQNCVKRTSTPLLLTRLAMGSWAKSLSPGKHRTYKTQGRSLTLMARSRFRYFLTLLTECFAPFDRSTCALSVLCRY